MASVGPMHRRDALKAVTGLTFGTALTGCETTPAAGPTPATRVPAAAASPSSSTSPTPPVLPEEITHGPRNRNRVAPTFHGQGEPAVVGALLDELAAARVRVTVLAVGTWLAAQPALARRVLDDGHELGNHTQHHADIKRMPAAAAHAEIAECAQALKALTGTIGRWFRPSQTPHATPTIKAAAAAVGYPTCLSYDVDSLDYTDPGAGAVVRTALSAVRPGSIVSLHCGHTGTVTAIAPLVTGLRRRGLTPVTMTELMT
jgi:peptidoglycan/xylan/chitin deacetylase (PgdA/CDA1 family)